MGLLKRAADLTYTFRFIRMLVLDWKEWDAYKLGIIDENGKRQKQVKLDSDEKKSAYTPFIRLCANIKRLVANIPGGSSKLGSFASALFLIKEKYELTDTCLEKILSKAGVDRLDMMIEKNEWFVLDDGAVSCEEVVWAKDNIRIEEDSYPVGEVFGISIYEALHMKTNQRIYVSVSEIYR
jgi:hypothetical protein